jgi:hypothetical protein
VTARAARLASVAAALAFASAAVSLFWTLGGTLGLDTVGGALEDLARDRSAGAIALGMTTVMLKATAGGLALALVRRRHRAVVLANALAAAVLVAWGGANVVIGGLVLAGVIDPSSPVDQYALRWHVFVWDMWFLVWGVVLALAVRSARPARRLA